MRNKIQNSHGFTLVEILLVVAIIGILSTLLMANFIGVRERGRDSQRKSNLRQIQSALELYRADNQTYPTNIKNCTGTAFGNSTCATIYMKKVPGDPLGAGAGVYSNYYYHEVLSGTVITGYILVACLENENDSDPDATVTRPSSPVNVPVCNNGKYYVLSD